MDKVQIAIFVVIGAALCISVYTDVRWRLIKNVVTYPTILLCLGLRAAGAVGHDQPVWGELTGTALYSGVVGMLVGGGLFLVVAKLGGMGLGDVKLMAAVGAAVGFPLVLVCMAFVSVVGGVQAIATGLWNGTLLNTLGGMGRGLLKIARVQKGDGQVERRPTYIPYGVAIALGTAWGVWWWFEQTQQPMAMTQ